MRTDRPACFAAGKNPEDYLSESSGVTLTLTYALKKVYSD